MSSDYEQGLHNDVQAGDDIRRFLATPGGGAFLQFYSARIEAKKNELIESVQSDNLVAARRIAADIEACAELLSAIQSLTTQADEAEQELQSIDEESHYGQ